MKILFAHLLNNFTGSPRVLANILEGLIEDKYLDIHLLTSSTNGCLSEMSGIKYHKNYYKWNDNKILLSFILLCSQIYQFFFVLFSSGYDVIYINTILPFGAGIAAKIRNKKVIYHVHEYYSKPNLLQKIAVFFAIKCSSEVIFVSNYLKNCYKGCFKCKENIIYNSVSKLFHGNAEQFALSDMIINKRFQNKIVVMPCALKKYKGIFEFLKLAKLMPNCIFKLVISNTRKETENFLSQENLPDNLIILNEVKNMNVIYEEASVVMNLSIPHGMDSVIETFSMTLIEAFEYGVPCIAPAYGGPTELIIDGKTGFLIEPLDTKILVEKIQFIFKTLEQYSLFSKAARQNSFLFSYTDFIQNIESVIQNNL